MDRMYLNGSWECRFSDGRIRTVEVPGCWDTYVEEKDIGEEVVYKKTFACGRRDGHFYELYFGGVSYYCQVFVNGIMTGTHEGLWDHFRIDITEAVTDGLNCLELYIVKPGYKEEDAFPVREVLSGFIPDVLHTFGGIWDDVYLEEFQSFSMDRHFGKGLMSGETLLTVTVNSRKSAGFRLEGAVYDQEGRLAHSVEPIDFPAVEGTVDLSVKFCIDEPDLWSTDDPQLYWYELTVISGEQKETCSRRYGYREVEACGSIILLNKQPVYLRGLLHWGFYDEAIIPNPDEAVIRDEIKKCRRFGFNMIKQCLYIPRDRYFDLADEMGMLLWVELPVWLPDVTRELEPRIEREYPRIMRQMEGHPSVIMMSLGCELDSSVSSTILEAMYHLAKKTGNALVRDNSGSGECYGGLTVDYADYFDYHFYGDLQNMENLMESFTPGWRNYRPWVYGEFCDSDTMRDLKEVRRKKGVKKLAWEAADSSLNPISGLKPDFRAGVHDERMRESGIRAEFELIKALSLDHSMVHRKTTLEQTRAFPAISGYNITCIRDVPIATSGFFDDCMEPKFDAELVRQFNEDLVLIPAWDLTRIWMNADRVLSRERYNFTGGSLYGLHLLLSNYWRRELKNPKINWKLTRDRAVVLEGGFGENREIACGTLTEVGYLHFTLPETEEADTYRLEVTVDCEDCHVKNCWPVFLYPVEKKSSRPTVYYDPANVLLTIEELFESIEELENGEPPQDAGLVITSRLTPAIKKYLEHGGGVILIQRGRGVLPSVPVAFWREGMIRTYEHDILKGCERKVWEDDLRYFSVSTDTALDTGRMQEEGFLLVNPIIRRYDCREWTAAEYMAEFSYGKGTMIATTLRLEGGMGKQPLFLKNNCLGRRLLLQMTEYLYGKNKR